MKPKQKPITLKPYNDRESNAWRRRATLFVVTGVALFCVPYGFYYALFTPYLLVPFAAPLAIMAVVAIWALPDLPSAPTRLLAPLIFTFVTALILWPNYLAIAIPGLPWITMVRLTSFPLTFVLLICVSVSAEFRAQVSKVLSATPMLWKALVLFAVAEFVSLPFSHYPAQSIQKIIVAQTSWTAVFFASCYVFLKPGRLQRFAVILWIMAMIVGGVGLAESPDRHVLWATHIPSFLKVGDETVLSILAGATRTGSDQYRVQSTFSTALGLAEYCSLALPFVLHFIAGPFRMPVRVAAALSVPFILYVIISTDARLGLLGFFISLMAYLFVWGLLQWSRTRSSLVGPATVMSYPVIFAMGIAASVLIGRIRTRIWGNQYEASNGARVDQFADAIPKILTHPLGHGIGTGAEALGYVTPSGLVTVDIFYVALAMDVGIIGIIAFLGMVISAIVYASKWTFGHIYKDQELTFLIPLGVSLVNFLVIKGVYAAEDNHALIFMMLGAVTALAFRARNEVAARAPQEVQASPLNVRARVPALAER